MQRKWRPPLRCEESSCCISSMDLLHQCWIRGHIPVAVLADCLLCSSWLISSYWNNYVIWVATAQHSTLWIWASRTAGWNKGCEKRKLMISCLWRLWLNWPWTQQFFLLIHWGLDYLSQYAHRALSIPWGWMWVSGCRGWGGGQGLWSSRDTGLSPHPESLYRPRCAGGKEEGMS